MKIIGVECICWQHRKKWNYVAEKRNREMFGYSMATQHATSMLISGGLCICAGHSHCHVELLFCMWISCYLFTIGYLIAVLIFIFVALFQFISSQYSAGITIFIFAGESIDWNVKWKFHNFVNVFKGTRPQIFINLFKLGALVSFFPLIVLWHYPSWMTHWHTFIAPDFMWRSFNQIHFRMVINGFD